MAKKTTHTREVGDQDFPLEVESETIDRTHKLVGELAEISPNTRELKDHIGARCRIMGVYFKAGQIAAFEVDINENRYTVAKKDLYLQYQTVEDVHLDTPKAQQVKTHMAHWGQTHDYFGPSWHGIERFHYELAKLSTHAGFETRGWYKYPSSTRDDMDGKDWRLILPDTDPIIVNCHSMLHDNVWSLATAIYSTREVDMAKVDLTGHSDFWTRVLLWTIRVAVMLQTDGYNYQPVISKLVKRLKAIPLLRGVMKDLQPSVEEAHQHLFGQPSLMPDQITVGIGEATLPANAAATFRHPTDIMREGVMSLSEKAVREIGANDIILHELIHAALGDTKISHGPKFKKMAAYLGLPEKYQD